MAILNKITHIDVEFHDVSLRSAELSAFVAFIEKRSKTLRSGSDEGLGGWICLLMKTF